MGAVRRPAGEVAEAHARGVLLQAGGLLLRIGDGVAAGEEVGAGPQPSVGKSDAEVGEPTIGDLEAAVGDLKTAVGNLEPAVEVRQAGVGRLQAGRAAATGAVLAGLDGHRTGLAFGG